MNIDYALSREKRPDFRYRLKRRTQEVLNAIKKYLPNLQSIIDLGTAEGRILHDISRKYPAAFCLGLDYSLPLLLFGKKRFPDIHLVCGDVEHLKFLKSETFDLVIATAVIEHLKSPQRMLRESHRLLKKRGILVITTPNPLWEKIANILGFIQGEHPSVMGSQEVLTLCQKEKFALLEHYGFMISPVGLWGERTIENILVRMKLDRFLPNKFLVAQKR